MRKTKNKASGDLNTVPGSRNTAPDNQYSVPDNRNTTPDIKNPVPGILYIVATPIGNLSDVTPRAISILAEADMIAAEDTRHSRPLLTHFQVKTPLHSYHAHNEVSKGDFFIRALQEGKNIALISDAGTPCISDPGYLLIRAAAEAGIEVVGVSGASAVVTALSVSGFDASRFVFIGFFPRKKTEQIQSLYEIITLNGGTPQGASDFSHNTNGIFKTPCPVVFYESPKRIKRTLNLLADYLPEAQICLCNDLTKKFERTYRGTPVEVAWQLTENPAAEKGEYTCVVQPLLSYPAEAAPREGFSPEAQLVEIMVKQNCDLKAAAAHMHTLPPKRSKKEIYAATLRLKNLFNRQFNR